MCMSHNNYYETCTYLFTDGYIVWSLQLGFVIGGANCICTLRFALIEFQLVFLVIYIVCVFLWPHTYLPLPNLGTPLQVGRWPVQVPGVPLLGGLGPWI